MGDEVTGIEIKLSDMDETDAIVVALSRRLGPGYRVQDWKEINRNLFSALKLEKIAMFAILANIIVVACLSIILNLIMVVVEKGREIAILKSMGADDFTVMRVFMIEGLIIGGVGTVLGITVGVSACLAVQKFGLPLDPNVYYINKLPVAMDWVAIVLIAVAGIGISVLSTLYPSWVAAKVRPVEGLRSE
jgi:lipoprotein-releasing system permease protein